MKILQVIPYFDWSYGGPVKVVYDISKELAKNGHEVTIFTTDVGTKGRLNKNDFVTFKENNIKIKYFKCTSNFLGNNLKLHFSPKMRLELKKNIKNYDIVHLHEWRSLPHIYLHHYATKYNVPYILQAHGASPKVIEEQKIGFILTKIIYDNIIGKKISADASVLIALNEGEKTQYMDYGLDEDKIRIIPNGIMIEEFIKLPKKGKFREKYNIKKDENIILYLGRITPIKGLDMLINAFAELMKIENDIKLVIIGPDYGFLSFLKNLSTKLKVKNEILFLGALYDNNKLEAFVDADLFILPSKYETFPISVIEACACGKPVIISKNCLISDIINNKVGYAVDYDQISLKDAMIKIIKNDKLRKEFSENGIELVKNELNWSKIVKRLEKIYEESYEK